MMITVILLGTLISLLLYYIWSLKSCHKYFLRRNIPGPPPKFFFGHYLDIWSTSSFHRQIQKWSRQYGPIYGIFEGTRPIYVVSDVNFLQEVYIKHFSVFHSRINNFLVRMIKSNGASLFSSHGNQWRRQRHVINPTFTAAKMKMMTPLINKCITSMMKKLDENNENEFNIFVFYKRLTMDVIWHCAFGIDTDLQNDIDNIYMKKSLAVFANDPEQMFTVRLFKLMPFLTPFLIKIINSFLKLINFLCILMPSIMHNVQGLPHFWILKQLENVVKQRLNSENKRIDLLQLMLNASTDQQIKDDENDELVGKNLHYKEVLVNSMLFLNAGFETTSLNLAYSTYELAKHPHIQKKLQDEIDQYWQEEKQIDYDILNDMEYLDMFIREVLRIHNSTHRVFNRECSQSTIISGHHIEKALKKVKYATKEIFPFSFLRYRLSSFVKNSILTIVESSPKKVVRRNCSYPHRFSAIIQPDTYTIYRSIDLWGPDDPNEFIPERHMIKRHPLAFMPFGIGPRNCVGMRFALMEIKIALANILHKYNILSGKNIEQGMKTQETFSLSPQAILIQIEKRSK